MFRLRLAALAYSQFVPCSQEVSGLSSRRVVWLVATVLLHAFGQPSFAQSTDSLRVDETATHVSFPSDHFHLALAVVNSTLAASAQVSADLLTPKTSSAPTEEHPAGWQQARQYVTSRCPPPHWTWSTPVRKGTNSHTFSFAIWCLHPAPLQLQALSHSTMWRPIFSNWPPRSASVKI